MSAEEAVETLRKLRFDIDSVNTEISDEQCDMLIDVDEDISVLDVFLQEIKKKEEEDRKRVERLQKANAKKRAAAAKKKEAEEKKAEEKRRKEEAAAAEAAAAIEPEPETEAVGPEDVQDEAPAAEVVAVEEAAAPVAEVLTEVAPEPEEAPAEPEPEPEPVAEILPPETPEEDAARAREASRGRGHDGPAHEATLARAEIVQEQEEKIRQQKKERPLPTPDPEVVAAVIRRDQEKRNALLADAGARRRGREPLGATPREARPATTDDRGDRETLFRNAPKKAVAATGKARKKPKRAERARVLEDTLRRDAAAAVREFQSGAGQIGSKKRRKKRHQEVEVQMEQTEGGVIEVDETMTVEQLADAMAIGVSDLILDLMDENLMVTKNQSLSMELIRKLADKRNFEVHSIIPEEDTALAEEPDDPADLVLRAPVVTVMGHVDHGKTSLLDVVRKANVADGEAGGITQHIAAYEVEMPSGRVVFLDTPGHEAFTQMRSRGAQVTDVVVLVVAADDGVKPQTIEAIDHAKAAEVPIVVAINKCDKPGAQPERVRGELASFGLQDESWGGSTIMRNVSAHTGEGIDDLMEMLVLESEMLELKANPNKRARGAIVESELSKGHGPVAWVLVQTGTLRPGDVFICGEVYGRVRTMTNSKGRLVKEAGPSTPVLVTGFSGVAEAGDPFIVVEEERIARTIAEKRVALSRQKRGSTGKAMTLEDFHALMQGVEQKSLNVIIKADAQGSVDVLTSSFAKLGNEEVSINVVHAGVGGVNESDVLLASASTAVIIGFHVTASTKVRQMAEAEGVDIRTYLVIYEAIDEVTKALEGLLAPDTKEVIVGHAEIRQVFRSSRFGNIAGCIQLDGETERGALTRLIRDNVVVYSGKIASVRREKDEVRSVSQGFECGLKLDRYDDIQTGDIIETYKLENIAKTLD
ncbi:MAG: translation initiation factor IF-2 [Candidatus Hydrogenedentes bacterium]|nr:translation initiation factor IF-2 [Candidatus Hydrogenedentota bacterium]